MEPEVQVQVEPEVLAQALASVEPEASASEVAVVPKRVEARQQNY